MGAAVRGVVAFKAVHGHSNVPSSYAENPSWPSGSSTAAASRSRGVSAGSIRATRSDRFRLGRADAPVRCSGLECHGRRVGGVPPGSRAQQCPQRMAAQSELAAWLHGVRCNKRSGRLDADRVRQLDVLGVVWEPQQTQWENMFAALVEYRQRHGDCNVPCGWPENPRGPVGEGGRAAQKRGELDVERSSGSTRSASAGSTAASVAGKRCTPRWPTTSMSMVTVGSPRFRTLPIAG